MKVYLLRKDEEKFMFVPKSRAVINYNGTIQEVYFDRATIDDARDAIRGGVSSFSSSGAMDLSNGLIEEYLNALNLSKRRGKEIAKRANKFDVRSNLEKIEGD